MPKGQRGLHNHIGNSPMRHRGRRYPRGHLGGKVRYRKEPCQTINPQVALVYGFLTI